MRTLLMVLFGVEALVGADSLAKFVVVAPSYETVVWVLAALRGLVTLGQGMVAMLLHRRTSSVVLFGRSVVAASVTVLTLEIGARLAPSNLPPGTRGLVILAYSAYAVFLAWGLGVVRK